MNQYDIEPNLKGQLLIYVAFTYEELSNQMTESDLLAEYNYLKQHNRLNDLYRTEQFYYQNYL